MDALQSTHKGRLSQTESIKESFRELLGHLSLDEITRNHGLMAKANELHRSLNRLKKEDVCGR